MIFASDNGSWLQKKLDAGSAGKLRDGKFYPYEGGIRELCIAWQPETVPNGVVSNVQTSTFDLLPTIALIANASKLENIIIDGLDISSILIGNNKANLERDNFLYRGDAIRMGDWKYVKTPK